ncbi:unnamed protein product [Didymodactylos carnosus]|uniref:Integrase zinc-binding domain-containing protein n=1 Tax=Didymodactylos carnosus TaxID=1234261 RepID=A0A815B324_9BILA|nr:unnamed protein product [Didymodactylos carnosus]CAF4046730.1 unnamed protein product [Didymodactylos carnosus]
MFLTILHVFKINSFACANVVNMRSMRATCSSKVFENIIISSRNESNSVFVKFETDIKHKWGTPHYDAECVSRYPVGAPEELDEWVLTTDDSMKVDTPELTKLNQTQDNVSNIHGVYTELGSPSSSRRLVHQQYVLTNDIVHNAVRSQGKTTLHLAYLPKSLISTAMKNYRNHITASHFGILRTGYGLRDKYYWLQMFNTIASYVKSCKSCQRFKHRRMKPSGTLESIPPPLCHLN